MYLHSLKNLKSLNSALLTAAFVLSTAMSPAGAAIIHSDTTSLSGAEASEQARVILDKASLLAFQGASAVQKLQSLSVDPATSAILKDYMASMIYIPQAMALPTDAEALDDETLVRPEQYKDGPMEDEPVDARALEFGDSPSLSKVLKFLKPVQNAFITSPFGFRWGRPHQGIDMAAPVGTPIVSAENGKVVFSGWKQGYGQFVAVDHGQGFETHYAHCSKVLVKVGQTVKKGQLIAKVGNTGRSTGPHLHFEVVAHGVHQNPAKFLNGKLTVGHAN